MKQLITFVALLMPFLIHSQVTKSDLVREIVNEKVKDLNAEQLLFEARHQLRGSTEIKVTTNTTPQIQEGEPMLVVNPTDSNNIVLSYVTFAASLVVPIYYSLDGGASWNVSSFRTDNWYNQDPQRAQLALSGGGDPVLAFDNDGKLYFGWLSLGINSSTFDGDFYVAWAESIDKGQSFRTIPGNDVFSYGAVNLISGMVLNKGDGLFDRPWFAVDRSGGAFDGSLYCVGLFIKNEVTTHQGDGIMLRVKRKGENKFDENYYPVAPNTATQFATVEVDDNGRVHVVYGNLETQDIVHRVSEDGGLTFSIPNKVGDINYDPAAPKVIHDRDNPAPSLTIDNFNDRLHVAYGFLTNDGQSLPMYAHSQNNGRAWSDPVSLLDFIPIDPYDQGILPTLGCNNVGEVSASFFALDQNNTGDFVVMESRDQGQSFDGYEVISSQPTAFASYPLNNTFSETFFGDYFESVRHGCKHYSAFSDGRNGTGPKVYISITDHCSGISSTKTIYVNDRLNVFPNPNNGSFHISVEDVSQGEKGSLKIYEVSSGKEVYNQQIKVTKDNLVIDTDLQSGVYDAVLILGGAYYRSDMFIVE